MRRRNLGRRPNSPPNTLIGVAALAFPEMIIEVDATAIVAGEVAGVFQQPSVAARKLARLVPLGYTVAVTRHAPVRGFVFYTVASAP